VQEQITIRKMNPQRFRYGLYRYNGRISERIKRIRGNEGGTMKPKLTLIGAGRATQVDPLKAVNALRQADVVYDALANSVLLECALRNAN
jgi:hypothetical protein